MTAGQQASDEFIITSRVPAHFYNPASPTAPSEAPQQHAGGSAVATAAAAAPPASAAAYPAQQAVEPPALSTGGSRTTQPVDSYAMPAGYPPAPAHMAAAAVYPGQPAATYHTAYAAAPAGYPVQPVVVAPHQGDLACGIGIQLLLFILGWLFSVCWWVGAVMYCCSSQKNPRERCAWIGNCIMTVVSIGLLVTVIILVASGTFDTCYYSRYSYSC